MGRGVEVPSNAFFTAYMDWEQSYNEDYEGDDEDDEDGFFRYDSDNWADDLGYYSDWYRELWPSLNETDDWLSWPYTESRVFLQNNLVRFVVSEYSGITAISVVPQEDGYGNPYNLGLGARWAQQIQEKFMSTGGYEKVGSFSNGEGVYKRRS